MKWAPAEIRKALDESLRHNAAQNAALLVLLAKVVARLRAAGVEAVPIKGAALMVLDPALVHVRAVSDVDLLVRRDDVDLAVSLLVQDGWRKQGRLVEIDLSGRLLPQGTERTGEAHGYTLQGETGLLLELHHALPSSEGSPREVGEAFFARSASVRWGRHHIHCPSLDDLLAIACEHVLVHHRQHLIHQPRLVIDLDVLLALGANPVRAKALWGAEVGVAVDEGLAVLEEARRGADSPTLLGRGKAELILSRAWRWARAIDGRARMLASAPSWLLQAIGAHGWRAFFPARHYMVARYKVRSRSWVVPLLYLWRPLRWAIGIITQR